MKHLLSISSQKNYDIVVCGGGFTGVACAYMAALKGKKVALIEKTGSLGGVGTIAAVPILLGGITYKEENNEYQFVVGGLFKRLYEDLRKSDSCINIYDIDRNKSPHGWYSSLANSIIFDIEQTKSLLDQYMKEANVDLYYFSSVIDTKVENNKINYVIVSNKSGNHIFNGKVIADCTGDADIAHMSGCEYTLGRDSDNLMAPASLIMTVENVDTDEYVNEIVLNNSPRYKEKIKELRDKGIWNFPYDILISIQLNQKNLHLINTIRQVGVDGTDSDSLTNGMIDGREENLKLFSILKEHFKGFKNAHIASMAEMIGIRETRRIKGLYTLTINDLIEGTEFDDVISLSSYGFDLPDPKKPSYQPYHEKKVKLKSSITKIPYRCLVPNTISNLICPGRAISVERDVLGPIRVMGPCTGMGMAAGIACDLAVELSCSIKDVPIKDLQTRLVNENCIINEDQIIKIGENI